MGTYDLSFQRRVEEPAASAEVRSNALSEDAPIFSAFERTSYASGGFQSTAAGRPGVPI